MRPGSCARLAGPLFVLASALPAAAQVGVSVGANVYESDEFCENSEAFFTYADVSYGADMFGASVSAMNSDIPWMPPPGSGGQNAVFPASASLVAGRQETQFLSQGESVQASVEAFPLGIFRRVSDAGQEGRLARLDRNLRPYVGVGLLFITDGDPAPAGAGGRNLPTFGLRSFIAPVITYGARLYLPSRESRIGVVLQYRGNSAFVSDAEYERPDGSLLAVGDGTLTWGTWSFGLSFRVGG